MSRGDNYERHWSPFLRARLVATLEQARIQTQIEVGFGDAIPSGRQEQQSEREHFLPILPSNIVRGITSYAHIWRWAAG